MLGFCRISIIFLVVFEFVIKQITQMLILKNLKMKMLLVLLHICLTSLEFCLMK